MGKLVHVEVLAKEARDALAGLTSSDLSLTDGEITELIVLTSEVAKLAEAAHVAVLGRLDVSRAWQGSGARSAAAWVAWQCHQSQTRSNVALKCARLLRDLPGTEAAFLAGRITVDHVRLLASARRANPEAFAVDEAKLVSLAQELLFRRFEVGITYWIHANDPDGAEADATSRYDSRRVDCSSTFEGMVVIDALLDPVTGEIVARELARLEQELFEADWAEARQRLGEGATVSDLRRTPKQRRADALRIMAERSAAKPADATEGRVLIHVLAGDQSVERMCELSDGSVVTPGEILPLLDRADVARVIFDGPSRVLDVGVRQRLFTGATRIAVEMRDRFCQHPSCSVPAERCEVDHVVPYEDGGLTVQVNGRCRCRFHHRWHHRQHPPAA
ncbi:MAG: DUF222 domain-containing protein [Microthrixaceae bacterium]